MDLLDEVRIAAMRSKCESFVSQHPEPVLVLWQQVEGDLQFANKGELEAQPREGDTLVHIPRVSARDRVRDSLQPGRQLVRNPRYYRLKVTDGSKPLTIGRNRGNDLRLNDYSVSATHSKLWGVPGTNRMYVEDNDSRNGTVHNGVSLMPAIRSELHSGDELVIGQFALLFLDASDFHRYLTGNL